MITGTGQFEAAVARSHTAHLHAEVWQGPHRVDTVQLGDTGSVSQVAGQFQRRSGSVVARNTRRLRELLVPGACLRVWWQVDGVAAGRGCPVLWGPIVNPGRTLGAAEVGLTVECMSRRVSRDGFPRPRASSKGATVAQMIQLLWREALPWFTWVDQSGDGTVCPDLTWEGSRAAAISKLAASIGCETFFRPVGSTGQVVLRKVPDAATAPAVRVREAVNLESLTTVPDWDSVVNHAVVTSDRGDGATAFGEYVDMDSSTGVVMCGRNVEIIQGAEVTTDAQARGAAMAHVLRSQGRRVEYGYTTTVLPGCEVSDVHRVSTISPDGVAPARVVLDSVRFDLAGAGMSVEARLPARIPSDPAVAGTES